MKEYIHFILTGGTIDSYFDPAKDQVVIGKKTKIKEYITKLKLHDKIKFDVLFLKDSREVRYTDRKKILDSVKKSKSNKIIITHGTYTMPDTAQYLQDQLKNIKKTIILVGSMIPLTGFEFSDASFNLGYAVAKVSSLPFGVYICMNGKVFNPRKVDKNRIKGRFEENG
ncbi:MAG: asparaginase domain-containing protein [Candidatus Micrarchaeia archaeon]